MKLILYNHIVDTDVETILHRVHYENPKYLNRIKKSGDNIAISCPFHNDGQERNPSCFVYCEDTNDDVPYGFYRCFTCGEQGSLYKLVSHCMGMSYEDSKQWLIDNYSRTFVDEGYSLEDIVIGNTQNKKYIDESVLDEFSYLHPYQFKRGLTEDVIKRFKVGYNPKTNCITFPVWDDKGGLVGITERSVVNKSFHIPSDMQKPIYLLNYIKQENISEVVVCESQINALTCWSWGIPAVALFGTGSNSQYDILKRTEIINYHLALDGDSAGLKGTRRFIESMPMDVSIDVIKIPYGKDVNDLSREEFLSLERIDRCDF